MLFTRKARYVAVFFVGLLVLLGLLFLTWDAAQDGERRNNDPIDQVRQEVKREPLALGSIKVPTAAKVVRVVHALPAGERPAEPPSFTEERHEARDGFVEVKLTNEPLWIIEGPLPNNEQLSHDKSPFGFHPASVHDDDYRNARQIGVVWDRGGLYLQWVLSQPDPKGPISWAMFDRYFEHLPSGFCTLKNITVAHDGMVKHPGRRPMKRAPWLRPVDVTRHLEGTTYRPKDTEGYLAWVRAAVERYDGDGVDDMPGLRTPAKHWQVDNEPPRRREGFPALQRMTYQAIKQADPEAKVLVGGLRLPIPKLMKLYEQEDLNILRELNGTSIDIYDVHWYGYAGDYVELGPALARLRKDLRRLGFGEIPIWFTEMGTHSGSPAADGRHHPSQTERAQAAEMVRRYVSLLGHGVEKVFWAWGMREGFSDPRDNDYFDTTGFIYDGLGPDDRGRGVKKSAYWGYQKMTTLLRYWNGSRPEKLQVEEGVTAFRFPFGNGRGIVAIWLNERHAILGQEN